MRGSCAAHEIADLSILDLFVTFYGFLEKYIDIHVVI